MKGKKCLDHLLQSRVFSAFLLLLLSLLVSLFPVNKANAISYTLNLNYIEDFNSHWTTYYRYGNGTLRTQNDKLTLNRSSSDSTATENLHIQYLCTTSSYSFNKDDFAEVKILTTLQDSQESIGALTDFYTPQNFTIQNMSVDYIKDNTITDARMNALGSYPYAYSIDFYPQQVVIFDIMLRARSTGSYPVCIGNTSTNRQIYSLPPIYAFNNLNVSYTFIWQPHLYIPIYHLDTSSEDMNEKDEEDRNNIESQQSESSDTSDDSQEDAENTGTTLLAAFSSFVTAITSASPSNCNLLMNMGNLNLGNVNLCQLSPPAEFQVIASIFLILFCVPLSIATARKVISLFRSFQT